MKTFFTFLMSALFAASALANEVTISFPRNHNYGVVIDGRNVFPNAYDNTINLTALSPGQHAIEVYRMKNNRKWKANQLIYAASFLLKPWSDVLIHVDDNGRVWINESNTGNRRNERSYNKDRHGRKRSWKEDSDEDRDDHLKGYGKHQNSNNDYKDNRYNDRVISTFDFDQLVQRIKYGWFNKLRIAKDAVERDYFTTSQVSTLVQLFSSESDKLELAKQAYQHTVDPQNYFQLYDVFAYRNSRDRLDRYIRSDP